MVSLRKRIVLSCFFVLGLFAVLYSNRPAPLIDAGDRFLDSHLSPEGARAARYASWLVQYYAFLTGLNQQWQMFGEQSRCNWWYAIKARYGDHEPLLLPLPNQSDRTPMQSLLTDFKENKLLLNLYTRPWSREAYAHYLCRQYPLQDGTPISSVQYELHWQIIAPREEAGETGMILRPTVHVDMIDDFECPKPPATN